MRWRGSPVLSHFATPSGPRFKLWNESRTNRARIADSCRLPFRSPQHLAWDWPAGTRSSLARSNKPGFEGEFLKVADDVESNQKWARVNGIPPRRPCLVRNCARAQGPITTGVRRYHRNQPPPPQIARPRRMGPCVRRDDGISLRLGDPRRHGGGGELGGLQHGGAERRRDNGAERHQ